MANQTLVYMQLSLDHLIKHHFEHNYGEFIKEDDDKFVIIE